MRPSEEDITGTETHAHVLPGHPHVVAMWPGGSIVKELVPGRALVVGRSRKCDLCIDHPSVSREHALVHGTNPATVEDRGSTNGTLVAGVRVPKGGRVSLSRGQLVSIGAAVLVIRSALDAMEEDAASRRRAGVAPRNRAPMIVADEGMQELYRVVDLVARGELSVILLGETGAGKDVIADSIHRRSARGPAAYVRVNCAALPDALLESELFGYERGAFTGAVQAKPGLLELADGGSVFLDEIAELPLPMQAKLLRVLESREVTRVGGVKSRQIDVRFICATNRDLMSLVRSGGFRQDLYFRLNGISLVIPPLRQRRAEIAPLARAFVADACRDAGRAELSITPEAMAALDGHDWPGNVRELRNAIERAVTLCTGAAIDVHHLPPPETGFGQLFGPDASPRPTVPSPEENGASVPDGAVGLHDAARRAAQTIERRRIAEAMERCGGNQTRAAAMLRISRRTLVARLTTYGFARPLKKRVPEVD
ncbi:MAG TPA: sigma 54-interacting transcriptional regulator [Polyangiaceae bacterium]|nr:sigma 54-interacting transcriptional regulator [Polyangiaceae bacterium]